jgi:hypothetical protein
MRVAAFFTLGKYSVISPVGETLYTRGTLPMPVSEILLHSKSITATNRVMMRVPTKLAASVRSERNRKESPKSRPFHTKVTDRCHLMSRTFAVTPYGSIVVTLTSLLDTLGCNIDVGAGIQNQASRHTLYLHRYSGCDVLQ